MSWFTNLSQSRIVRHELDRVAQDDVIHEHHPLRRSSTLVDVVVSLRSVISFSMMQRTADRNKNPELTFEDVADV
jgi:hypothetical protein